MQILSKIAKTEPHAAYSNFIYSMKQKWNFAMRTIPDISQHLQPLEKIIREEFIPKVISCPVNDYLRDMIALPVRMGGLGIINPVDVADMEYRNSTRLTSPLTNQIIEQDSSGVTDRNVIKEIKKTDITRKRKEPETRAPKQAE